LAYENKKYFSNAFHFDANKVGMYFKNLCPEVVSIDAVVDEVVLDINGSVEKLILDTKKHITADVFIDCSGFNRVLMKKMKIDWVSTQDVLPVNTAMPFIINYEEEEVVKPHTGATAMDSGWMWDIPLTTRRGCGYVYDSNFITEEKAVDEVQKYFKKTIEPLKFIKFDSGYSKKFLHKNVVCLGLSSSFFEPLEATSIHNTIVQTSIFVEMCLRQDTNFLGNNVVEKMYNKRITRLMEHTANFISMHYQGGRVDTPFWKRIKDENIVTDEAKFYIDMAEVKIPVNAQLDDMWGSYTIGLMNWVFAGMGIITKELAKKELDDVQSYYIAEELYHSFVESNKLTMRKHYIHQI